MCPECLINNCRSLNLNLQINQGGKIPKSYYTKNITTDQPKKEYTTATIKKGEKLTLDFIIAEEGCVLR